MEVNRLRAACRYALTVPGEWVEVPVGPTISAMDSAMRTLYKLRSTHPEFKTLELSQRQRACAVYVGFCVDKDEDDE